MYLPHVSATFNNSHAIPSAPFRVKTTSLSMFSFSLVARTCSEEMARPVGSDWVKRSSNECPSASIGFVLT